MNATMMHMRKSKASWPIYDNLAGVVCAPPFWHHSLNEGRGLSLNIPNRMRAAQNDTYGKRDSVSVRQTFDFPVEACIMGRFTLSDLLLTSMQLSDYWLYGGYYPYILR